MLSLIPTKNKKMSFFKKSAPLFIVFIVINILIVSSMRTLEKFNISSSVLTISNLFFLIICLISTAIQQKALKNKNANVFVRSIMMGMMLKMFSSAILLIVYIFYSNKQINKRGVFISLFFYLIYLGVEVLTIMKQNKKSNV